MKKLLFCALMTVLVLHFASSLVLSEDTDFRKGSEAGVCFMTGGVSKGERADQVRGWKN